MKFQTKLCRNFETSWKIPDFFFNFAIIEGSWKCLKKTWEKLGRSGNNKENKKFRINKKRGEIFVDIANKSRQRNFGTSWKVLDFFFKFCDNWWKLKTF